MNPEIKPNPKPTIPAIPTYLAWAAWLFVASIALWVLIALPVGFGESSLIGRLVYHWPLTALIVLVGLMIAGYFGGGLGLPTLFRDDPDAGPRIFGRSFGAGFGASLVVVVIWVVIFFCDFVARHERYASHENRDEQTRGLANKQGGPAVQGRAPREVKRADLKPLAGMIERLREMVESAATFEGDGRLRDQLRRLALDVGDCQVQLAELSDGPAGPGRARSHVVHPLEILAHLDGVHQEILSIKEEQARLGNRDGPARLERLKEIEVQSWRILSYLNTEEFQNCFAFGSASVILLLLGCVGVVTRELAKRRMSSGSRFVAHRELRGYVLGCIALLLLASIMLVFLFEAFKVLRDHVILRSLIDQSDWFLAVRKVTRFQHAATTIGIALFIAGLIAVFSITLHRFRVGAGLGICMLFSNAALFYLFLYVIQPGSQLLVVGGLVVGLVSINSHPFKYRFPGMDSYYEKPLDLHQEDETIEREGAKGHTGPLTDGEPILLDDLKVLDAWASRLRAVDGGKPKLVLVTATGAAYRASFWTTVVLERLEEDLPGFLNHVRLITGASGGMVGAAYVVAMLEEPVAGLERSPKVEATDRLKADSDGDSLSPVVRKLIDGDLPRALLPWTQAEDRGRTLENQWKTLDGVTFADLRRGEKEGWRPSLVLSPMIVENGRRLLITNLDLYGLTDIQARNRESVSIDDEDRRPLPAEGGHRRLSRSAAEFFRAFPKSYHEFQVKVGVRMNASFPFISPAVSLPVEPPRRLADAGYYDNYGVNLAAAWAFANRRWIRENTSGLALVQIRAYESEAVRKRLWVQPREADTGQPPRGFRRLQAWLARRLASGIHALTTPFEGLSNARQWSMSYRNDEQVNLLREVFNDARCDLEGGHLACVDHTQGRGENGWFDTFVFENPLSFGMNWLMTRGEIEEMRKCFDPGEGLAANARLSKKNLDQLGRLKAWWGEREDRGSAGPAGSRGSANGQGPDSSPVVPVEPIPVGDPEPGAAP